MSRGSAAAIALIAAAACARAGRVDGSDVMLSKVTGRLPELERVWSLAELPDGRVAIPQSQAVLRADLGAGTADTLGRRGEGPGEYKQPFRVLVLHGGIAMLDGQLSRLSIWNLDGTVRSTAPVPRYVSFGGVLDTLGHAFFEQLPANISIGDINEAGRAKDSTAVYRMTLPGPQYDTVAKIYEIGKVTIRFGDGATFRPRLYQTPDVWGVLPDGTLWIARGRENRIDRMTADGKWTIGIPRPWTPIPVTKADWRKMHSFPGLPSSSVLDTMYEPMAESKGPFAEAVAAPDGEVWTRLHQQAGYARERYAIFPVSGASTRTASLPLGRILIAITARNLYTIHEDADGFWELERFDRPEMGA
jgi:hypothetical protein